jgi:hypothetical protein
MTIEHFLNAYEQINKNLVGLDVNYAFNSIGSNVFFDFGKVLEEELLKNGKKYIRKEWSIWIGDASWRISKKGIYIVGSFDPPEAMESHIQSLIGKRFQSLQFLSPFLDAAFNFEEGYQLTTFFNWAEENQWRLCLPDETRIQVDCSSQEAIKNVQEIATRFTIHETYKKLDFPQEEIAVIGITYDRYEPIFHFENQFLIVLENCTWRLEKNGDYLVGCIDLDKGSSKLLELIGRKLKQVEIANSMMDARFEFEDHYVLKTFTCCHATNQWKILSPSGPIFQAHIQLLEKQKNGKEGPNSTKVVKLF